MVSYQRYGSITISAFVGTFKTPMCLKTYSTGTYLPAILEMEMEEMVDILLVKMLMIMLVRMTKMKTRRNPPMKMKVMMRMTGRFSTSLRRTFQLGHAHQHQGK